jgi:hypothetical protein
LLQFSIDFIEITKIKRFYKKYYFKEEFGSGKTSLINDIIANKNKSTCLSNSAR